MTDNIRPISGPTLNEPTIDRREGDRRRDQRRAESRALSVTDQEPETHEPTQSHDAASARPAVHPALDGGPTAFMAQQLGQSGQKRGLRGGPPVIKAARSAYLGAEYSGAADRRPKPGQETDDDI